MSGFLPGFVQAAAGSGAAALPLAQSAIAEPRQMVVFRPSGVASENVYTSWALAVAAYNAIQGFRTLQIDLSLVAYTFTLPTGAFSLAGGELFAGNDSGVSGLSHTLTVPEGCTLPGLRQLRGNLIIDNAATATVPVTDFVDGDFFRLTDGASISTSGSVAFCSASALSAGELVIVNLDDVGNFGFAAAATVFDMPVTGTIIVTSGASGSFVGADTIAGVAGVLWLNNNRDTGMGANASQTAFLGTRIDTNLETLWMNPSPISTAAIPASSLTIITSPQLYDVSGGAVAQTIPLALNRNGQPLIFREVSGTAGLTIVPTGADTINGVAGPYTIPGDGGVWLVANGVSDWVVVAFFDPSAGGPHAIGGASHTASTLAAFNALISDATLDDSTASRPPNGAASGGLAGTYPSPTVDGMTAGVLTDDTAHGVRGGGTQHANVVAAGADGFMTGADKTKLDSVGAGALGYVLNFGGIALIGDIGKYWEYEGEANAGTDGTLNEKNEAVIPKTATLKALAWNSALGDATTVAKVLRNGIVVATVGWTGASGIVTGLSVAFTEGTEKIAIEFDAGTAPSDTTLTPYFEAT